MKLAIMARLIICIPFLLISLPSTFGDTALTDLNSDVHVLTQLIKDVRSLYLEGEGGSSKKGTDNQNEEEVTMKDFNNLILSTGIESSRARRLDIMKRIRGNQSSQFSRQSSPATKENDLRTLLAIILEEATKIRDRAQEHVEQLIQAIDNA